MNDRPTSIFKQIYLFQFVKESKRKSKSCLLVEVSSIIFAYHNNNVFNLPEQLDMSKENEITLYH